MLNDSEQSRTASRPRSSATCLGSSESSLNRILLVPLGCVLRNTSGTAQINRANLNGKVTDTSGASVPSAKVEVVAVNTGLTRETTSGVGGVYSISSLPVGKYNLTI
jgi:hypothetical protein